VIRLRRRFKPQANGSVRVIPAGRARRQSASSGFRRDVDEICALPPYYAASSGNCLQTFRDNISVPSSRVFLGVLTVEDRTDMLSRNVGRQVPHDVA
jgi:hypothetical protein